MVKISKKEYETLKSLGERWIWIARDSGDDYIGQLFAYLEKPYKSYDVGCWRDYDGGGFSSTDSYLFQFIQWSDSEPYNIAELIRGYEWAQLNEKYPPVGESEETEVKDTKWLKEQLDDIEMNTPSLGSHDSIWMLDRVNELLNQLDDPETTLDRAFEKVAESYPMTKEEIWRHLERFEAHGGKVTYGESEVLSQEWIVDNVSFIQAGRGYVLGSKLQNLLVPKQELPVIPQFVFDWIEKCKNANILEEINYLNRSLSSKNMLIEHELYFWLKNNFDTFAKAWIAYPDIEVEGEQKYCLKIGNLYLAEPLGDMTSDIVRMTRDKEVAYQFTDIATHLDKFKGIEAVKVEEMEEWE